MVKELLNRNADIEAKDVDGCRCSQNYFLNLLNQLVVVYGFKGLLTY